MRTSPSRIFVVAVAAAVLLQACPRKETAQPETVERAVRTATPCRPSTTAPDPNSPQLDCPAPPSTWDVSAYFANGAPIATTQQAGPAFDSWAWASFAAYNWPAKADASQPTGYVRGIPDTNASFLDANSTQVVVWETFKEKREVFNNDVQAGQWQPLTYSTAQTLGGTGGIPACTTQDQDKLAKLPGGAHRRILQASKLAPMLNNDPEHELDETAEVSSPAQEAQNALCAGYTGAALTTCQTTFVNPPSGGPTTPFSPTIPNPRPGVGPRVYDPNKNLIYYEVRVNYDYFSYALTNGLNFVNPPPPPAPPPPGTPKIQPPYSLPWRSSALAPPVSNPGPPIQPAQLNSSIVKYEAATTAGLYASAPTTPPAIGSVQVKSAWMVLNAPDPSFHTTEAVYFQTQNNAPCYSVGTFGLLALHIIQRTHMGDSSDQNAIPVGGTFIFATWEHNSIANGAGYSYVNFLASGGADQSNPMPYPALANAIPVTRQQQYPLASTNNVTQAVYKQLPQGSVWSNYRLIGTQFYPNVTSTTSINYNQPYYLANLVVETNNGLQNFQGLPPGITPVLSNFPPPNTSYQPLANNLQFNGNQYDMGGCMGCHGVAQVAGSNFSFVLLDGQRGAGVDTATDVSIPPDLPPTSTSTSQ